MSRLARLRHEALPEPADARRRLDGNRSRSETHYAQTLADPPPTFREIADAYEAALEDAFSFAAMRKTIWSRDPDAVRALWKPLVKLYGNSAGDGRRPAGGGARSCRAGLMIDVGAASPFQVARLGEVDAIVVESGGEADLDVIGAPASP